MFGSSDSRARRGAGWPATALSEPVLAPGDLVGVCATGFAVRPGSLDAGLQWLSDAGYVLRVGRHVAARDGYFAGTDRERLDDLTAMLEDPDLRAVWFARGGYGTARLLDGLPWRRISQRPKALLGYSDLTALFCAVIRAPGSLCLYGPVVAELGERGGFHRAALRRLLSGRADRIRFARRAVVSPGRARGRLVGGNLSVLAHLLGTRWLPDFRGTILALEDTGESLYRIDRLLTHLRQAGVFRHVAGVLLGGFDPAPRSSYPPDRDRDEVLREAFEPLGVPVVRDLPFGHVRGKRTLPLGGGAELDTAAGVVTLNPRPVP